MLLALPLAFWPEPPALVGAVVLTAAALSIRSVRRDPRGWVLSAATLGAGGFSLTGLTWQVLPMLCLVVLAALAVVRRRSGAPKWPVLSRDAVLAGLRGSAQPRWLVAAAVIAVGAGGFMLWYVDAEGQFAFGQVGIVALLAGAAVNAVIEEVVWRGAGLDLLLRGGWSAAPALALQAVSFGFAHWVTGTPGGSVGSVAAGVFGLALGLVAWRTRSLALPVLIHFAVDVVIIASVFGWTQFGWTGSG